MAAERALRTWGRGASAACRKAAKRIEPWEERVTAVAPPKGSKWSKSDVERVGRLLVEMAEAAEYEYRLLRDVAMPTEPAAVDAIQSFFDKEEEALILVQRLGIEMEKRNDLEAFVTSYMRIRRLVKAYERDARAVHAAECADSD